MLGQDLRLKSLSVAFGDTTAVRPTDLDIAGGAFVSILGPSGCGKTTLLRAVAGFLAPALGRVLIGGVDVTDLPPERRPTALIVRTLALFPRMSVADNVGFGLEARGMARAARRARAEDLLDLVDLAGFGDRTPGELSASERLRVAIARALAIEPAVLLLDEPLAALDPDLRRRMRSALKAVQRRSGVTVLAITDDPSEALTLSDRIAVMNAGRIEQVDTPDHLYSSPATPFVARFVGAQNVLPGRVTVVARDLVEVATAVGPIRASARVPLAVGDAVEVMIRPERLLLEADRGPTETPETAWNGLRADLVGRTLEGAGIAYDFAVGATRLVMHRPNLGPRNQLLANLHAIGFHAEDALAFPVTPPEEGMR